MTSCRINSKLANSVRRLFGAYSLWSVIILAPASGCSSVSITYEMKDHFSGEPVGGKYDISEVDLNLVEKLRKHAPKDVSLQTAHDSSAMPISIRYQLGENTIQRLQCNYCQVLLR